MRDVLEAAVTILMMGAVPIIIRHISANPWTIGLVRLGVATAGMALIVGLTRRWVTPNAREVQALALIGLLFGAHWALYFISIKVSSAAIAVIGQSTFGVHLVILGWVIGHHRVERADLVAVACAVTGALMVAPRWSLQNHDTVGLLLGIVSSFFYAFLPILHQRLSHVSSAMRVLGQFVFGLLVFVPSLPAAEWRLSADDWLWLMVLAVVCTLVQHTSVDAADDAAADADDQRAVLPGGAGDAHLRRRAAGGARVGVDAGGRGADCLRQSAGAAQAARRVARARTRARAGAGPGSA